MCLQYNVILLCLQGLYYASMSASSHNPIARWRPVTYDIMSGHPRALSNTSLRCYRGRYILMSTCVCVCVYVGICI